MTNVGPDHSKVAKSLLEVKPNIQYYISITKTFSCTNNFTYNVSSDTISFRVELLGKILTLY